MFGILLKRRKKVPKKYNSIDMPLGVFINAIVDGDTTDIDNWDDILMDYCDAIGGKELESELKDVSEISRLSARIQIAETCLNMLRMNGNCKEVMEILTSMYPMAFGDGIERFVGHISLDSVDLQILLKERGDGNTTPDVVVYDRNYFVDILIAVSAAFKVNVGMDISVREYCRWVVKYKEYAEEMHKRQTS